MWIMPAPSQRPHIERAASKPRPRTSPRPVADPTDSVPETSLFAMHSSGQNGRGYSGQLIYLLYRKGVSPNAYVSVRYSFLCFLLIFVLLLSIVPPITFKFIFRVSMMEWW